MFIYVGGGPRVPDQDARHAEADGQARLLRNQRHFSAFVASYYFMWFNCMLVNVY